MENDGMHLVVELLFDQATEAAVRAVWCALADGLPLAHPGAEARPHVSLTVYQGLDVAGFRTALAGFAASRPALDIELESWGAFAAGECVVFLAPIVTRDLLALHQDFQERFAQFGAPQPYYRPGAWIPHCTLAAGFPADLLPQVADACHRAVRPLHGRIESIALVEYGPRREHFAFGFGGLRGARR
jgi:hypothetical protein